MADRKTAPRRSREPRARAFSFVLNQFHSLAKQVMSEDEKEPSIVTYWQCFFPEIRGRDYTRSNFEKGKGPEQLLEILQPNVEIMMSQEDLRAVGNFNGSSLFGKSCLVGWILRTWEGPFCGLITSTLFDEYFDKKALEEFYKLLAQDFRSPNYLFQEFKTCLDDIYELAHGTATIGTEPWPDHPAQYAEYMVNKAQSPQRLDFKADLATTLIMAALNGPRDYRPDLLIFNRPQVVATEKEATHDRYPWNIARGQIDKGTTTAYLSRVTFPTDPADAREWMLCESSSPIRSDEMAGTMTYPLVGISKVDLVRASDGRDGFSRYTRIDDSCIIPLDCNRVSSEHAQLTLEDDGWYLTDLETTNGTLLIRVNEDRYHLCREGLSEVRENHVRLENGDVICLAPDWANEQPLNDSPAFVFQLAASKW